MARILFVDDDLDTLHLLSMAVVIFGHIALQAASGEEALRLAAKELPDLILLDMRMSGMDGIAVIKSILSNPLLVSIPIVMVSALPAIDLADKARAAGAIDYLQKPIGLHTLQDIIQKYTNGKK
jgi:CheY-like chemotaxis protein